MEQRLHGCFVPEFTDDALSDHVPVIATFEGFD